MASLAFVFSGPSGTVTVNRSVSDADAARLIGAYGAAFGSVPVDPAHPEGPRRALTPPEIIGRWADGQIAASIEFVRQHERTVAAETAAAAVRPIEVQS